MLGDSQQSATHLIFTEELWMVASDMVHAREGLIALRIVPPSATLAQDVEAWRPKIHDLL